MLWEKARQLNATPHTQLCRGLHSPILATSSTSLDLTLAFWTPGTADLQHNTVTVLLNTYSHTNIKLLYVCEVELSIKQLKIKTKGESSYTAAHCLPSINTQGSGQYIHGRANGHPNYCCFEHYTWHHHAQPCRQIHRLYELVYTNTTTESVNTTSLSGSIHSDSGVTNMRLKALVAVLGPPVFLSVM